MHNTTSDRLATAMPINFPCVLNTRVVSSTRLRTRLHAQKPFRPPAYTSDSGYHHSGNHTLLLYRNLCYHALAHSHCPPYGNKNSHAHAQSHSHTNLDRLPNRNNHHRNADCYNDRNNHADLYAYTKPDPNPYSHGYYPCSPHRESYTHILTNEYDLANLDLHIPAICYTNGNTYDHRRISLDHVHTPS